MKISAVSLALLSASCASAFTVMQSKNLSSASSSQLAMAKSNDSMDRRAVFQSLATSTLGLISSAAVLQTDGANASLLDDFGTDPTKIKDPSLEAEKEAARKAAVSKAKAESSIEPNLRSNYYYPTNKKRYLPRIKKCNDAIPEVAELIGKEDWEAVDEFANKIADDTILPMKLYTSSLTGGGTNVKVSFTKDMMQSADAFEKAQKSLVKSAKKRDQTASSKALEEMATALLSYRTSGRLLGPDGGGDIPSVDEIRRSACRVQGRSFEKKVKDRDDRLAKEAALQASRQ